MVAHFPAAPVVLLVTLILPVSVLAQTKFSGVGHAPVVSLPQGKETRIPSPNSQWILTFKFPDPTAARKLWIQQGASSQRTLIGNFDRSLEISWAPDSRHFFVNDASGSGETRSYVFDPVTLKATDLSKIVAKAAPKAADYLGADHSYLEIAHWINSHEVLVKMMAYFSESAPQWPGFRARYRVDLNGTVQNLYEGYWQSTCDGVNRDLTPHRKAALAPEIAKQLNVKSVDVLQSFRFGTWQIIYVSTEESDPPFLFYSGDPLRTRYVTMWSGAARMDEEQEIRAWTLKNAPGIPRRLASCFAWHVTKAQDQ